MMNIFSKSTAATLTPNIVAEWEKRYGDRFYKLEIDGQVAYCRSPSDKEMVKILKKVCGGNLGKAYTKADEVKTLKRAFAVGFLGGDKEIIDNPKVLQLIKTT